MANQPVFFGDLEIQQAAGLKGTTNENEMTLE